MLGEMLPHLRRFIPALLLLLLCSAAWIGARAVPPLAPPAPVSAEGWTEGQPAAGMADALTKVEPVAAEVPVGLAALIKGPTALFYFSPTCPHCQHAMPEVNPLNGKAGVTWIGVAVGSSTTSEMNAFKAKYKPTFQIWTDSDHAFARAFGARSTPSVYLVEPGPAGANAPPSEGMAPVLVSEAYTPWRRGLAGYFLVRRHPDDPFRDFQGYQSDATCGACHTQELASWMLTPHSIAYRTLYLRERAMDQECVSCHVTGMGKPGGFEMADHSSPLTDVSCEACHGASGPHDGEGTVSTDTCKGCHDKKHSIAFSVAKGLPHIDHYRINALSDAEVQAQIQALSTGDAPQPLLAFPEGPTLGAAACQSCHKAEHKSWAGDKHGGAMALLKEPDRSNPECVSCHATPVASGPLPKALSSYRMDEGVGCEACHGPGGEHVKAPTAANIVGLGESCPECVIDAICTSCHTSEWDPKWELKARLAAAKHASSKP